MTSSSPPALRFPELGPLTKVAVLYDFSATLRAPRTVDWDAEIPLIIAQRLAAVVHRVILDNHLLAPAHVVGQLQNATFAWAQASCIVSKIAIDDLAHLQNEKIDYVVTKGPGIAGHARHISERPFSDVDIFVSKNDFDRVLKLFKRLGYAEDSRNVLPWQILNRYCREAINLRSSSGGSLDVHHRIPPWYWGSHIDFSSLRDRAEPTVAPGGGWLLCASPTDNLLISALHIVSDKSRPGSNLMAWRDFLQLAHICEPRDVVLRGREAHLCGWLKWIIGALPSDARPENLTEALIGEDPSIPGQYRLSMLLPPKIGSRHLVGQVFRLPVANAALYAAGMAWPSSAFLRSKSNIRKARRSTWLREGILRLNNQMLNKESQHLQDSDSSSIR
jgi:hypothetical protein